MPKEADSGSVAEYRFAAEALARNLLPCWPSSNMYPYDMILDTGWKRHRIQVKSSSKKTARIKVEFRMINGRSTRKYTPEDVDFIVLYLSHYDIWYLLPISEARVTLTVHPEDSSCKNHKYIDAWHLLE